MSAPKLTRVDDRRDLPCYDVTVDGVVIGQVFRSRTSWERRPAGRCYVTARGETDRYWKFQRADRPGEWSPSCLTRTDAVRRLVEYAAEDS